MNGGNVVPNVKVNSSSSNNDNNKQQQKQNQLLLDNNKQEMFDHHWKYLLPLLHGIESEEIFETCQQAVLVHNY